MRETGEMSMRQSFTVITYDVVTSVQYRGSSIIYLTSEVFTTPCFTHWFHVDVIVFKVAMVSFDVV